MSRHTFALYYRGASGYSKNVGARVTLDDKALHHRMVHVLRFSVGDCCILFDTQYYVTVRIEAITKKHLELCVDSVALNMSLVPEVTLLLPVLKKQALAEAVYSAVEMGVSTIQLVMTQKVQRKWDGLHELERLQSVVVAACEQAKYFAVPKIKAPVTLQEALATVLPEGTRIYYDPEGVPVGDITLASAHQIVVMVGPEGDLTEGEKVVLRESNFNFVRLTPTVLRSVQAVALGVGLVRSMG